MSKIDFTKMHDDHIINTLIQDSNLMQLINDITTNLSIAKNESTNTKMYVSVDKLSNALEKFKLNVYNNNTMKFVNEQHNRRLPDPKNTKTFTNLTLINQMNKLKELLEDCIFRHDDIKLATLSNKLSKQIDQFVLNFADEIKTVGKAKKGKSTKSLNTKVSEKEIYKALVEMNRE